MHRIPVLLILIFLISSTISATYSITYEPAQFLEFKAGGPSTVDPFNANQFVVHIGTFTIDHDQPLYDPTMYQELNSTHFGFTGRTNWNPNSDIQTETFFRLAAASNVNGSNSWTYRMLDWGTGGDSLTTQTTGGITTNPLIVKLYLVSDNTTSVYIENEVYKHTSGTFGSFFIAMADSSNGHVQGDSKVPVNYKEIPSDEPRQPSSVPFIPSGNGSIIPPPVPYGDSDQPTTFLFSIVDEKDFPIESAFSGNSYTIGQAKVLLSNTNNKPYGVYIVFSNRTNTEDFSLHLNGIEGEYPIPYKLLFKKKRVKGGQKIKWKNLREGETFEPIKVTGIVPSRIDKVPAGDYSDTIYVTITPSDYL